MTLIVRLFKLAALAAGALLAVAWLVLDSSLFNATRSALLEGVLTKQIGQPVFVNGHVGVRLGAQSHINVSDVEIPSENIPDFQLAKLNNLELHLALSALLQGRISFHTISASGLEVQLWSLEDGTVSWSKKAPRAIEKEPEQVPDTPTPQGLDTGIAALDFIKNKTVSFADMSIQVENQSNGFEFDFLLDALDLVQLSGGTHRQIASSGTVNGEAFTVTGNFPHNSQFETLATFGDLALRFDGTAIGRSDGGGYTGTFDLEARDLGELLQVLRLDWSLAGSGKLTADITRQQGVMAVDDLLLVMDGARGKQFVAQGAIGNVFDRSDVDIRVKARLHPENAPPAQAARLSELKLAGVETRIVSETNGFEFEDILIRTNLIDQGLDEVGPIDIGDIRRTDDNKLALRDIKMQAGPPDAPVLVAQGHILDALNLKQYEAEGEILLPASLLLGRLGSDVSNAFGAVRGTFSLGDPTGSFGVQSFGTEAVDTEVWAMTSQMELGKGFNLNGFSYDLDLEIQDGKSFFDALRLEPVNTDRFELTAMIRGEEGVLSADFGVGAGGSELMTSVKVQKPAERVQIDGRIFSEELALDDVRNAVAGLVELAKIGAKTDARKPQPLVLEREAQPLVLPKPKPRLRDIFSADALLKETDLNAQIDIEKLSGVQGVTDVSADLTVNEGAARFGPLEVSYGEGHLRASAAMDLIDTPELLSISATTRGWNFGNILDSVGLGIDAYGILAGQIDVTGNHRSVSSFVNSMRGSASLRMTNGEIGTSLLELAGLGIFPWLFSEELRQKRTTISCLNAPVQFNAGRMSFDPIVAETKRVQLVARGALDWKNDSISLRAEPRPIGKPLSRSAWPFEVTGALSNPQFDLLVGGVRSRRADGANQMPENRTPCVVDIYQLQ